MRFSPSSHPLFLIPFSPRPCRADLSRHSSAATEVLAKAGLSLCVSRLIQCVNE